jgi:hypothetical protein
VSKTETKGEIMKDKLTFGDEGFSEQMMKDVAFSPEDLDSAYINQASLYAYYAEQSRIATKKMDNFKLRIDAVEAELDKQIRNEAAESGTKITEKAIEQNILRDEKYVKAVMSYNDAKAVSQMLRDILDAFKQRKDMLIQVGLTRRDELRVTGMRVDEKEHPSQDDLKKRRDKLAGKAA